ncbi:S41 family peptidase [Sphingobacterium sp. SRCM116780]|uniref:S41 family peptidase n=1 Tax=Sphingobacterium sp. SRCM116780 TaxID=2907623 RepID=UPI001F1CF9BD|nr:S41 family peptidase [Sphingobacterium sp. SRCM116780]UIR55226.1 S41 family peptidase [Sphingobacterium sp. SRCM116780]
MNLRFFCLIFIYILFCRICVGQDKIMLSPLEQREDFKALVDTLKLVHPNIYQRISEKKLNNIIDSLALTMQKEISLAGFYHKSMELLQRIADGHLAINPFSLNKDVNYASPIYNFRYYLKDEHIYIVDSNEEDKHLIGYELQSINGIPVQKIIKYITAGSICFDGENNGFQTYYLNEFFHLPYFMIQYFNLESTAHFILKKGNDIVELVLEKDINKKTKWFPTERPKIVNTGDNEVGYRRFLYSMGLNSFQSATAVEAYFDQIGLDTLGSFVLDLRNNTGGFNHLSMELLSYFISDTTYYLEKGIMNESFLQFLAVRNVDYRNELVKVGEDMRQMVVPSKKSFKGTLYVLVNNGTFSNGAYLASHLKRQKNVVLVGDTVGGSGYSSIAGRMIPFNLPNSKLQVTMGAFYNQIYGGQKSDSLLTPTIFIPYDIEDIILKKDKEMAWVIALMKKTNNFAY